eukprot:1159070-Pelagomonas_calceolata.AAC.10
MDHASFDRDAWTMSGLTEQGTMQKPIVGAWAPASQPLSNHVDCGNLVLGPQLPPRFPAAQLPDCSLFGQAARPHNESLMCPYTQSQTANNHRSGSIQAAHHTSNHCSGPRHGLELTGTAMAQDKGQHHAISPMSLNLTLCHQNPD